MTDALLRYRNFSLEFPSPDGPRRVLDGIDLELRPNEIVGLVGESGSGKSVAAMSALRLLPRGSFHVAGGSLEVLGRDVMSLKQAELATLRGGQVAMVFQEPMNALNPSIRVGRQVAGIIRRHRPGMDKAAVTADVLRLLSDMRIDDPARVAGLYPSALSGGMRQRVLLAMAFACRPRILIADEPTTALDVTVQAQVLDLIRDHARATGTAVLFISHDLAVVGQLCDRLYVLHRGVIKENGPARQILSRPAAPYTAALLAALPDGKPPRSPLPVIGAEPVCDGEALPAPARAAGEAIRVAGLTLHYPGRATPVVDGVDLSVAAGSTLGIVGESGSGKSTLAQALVGLLPPSAGRIVFYGSPLVPPRRWSWGQPPVPPAQIVFQDPQSALNPRLRTWDLVTEPLAIRGVDRAGRRAGAVGLLRQVGLAAEHLDRFPHEFSGGQRQRLAIARALAADPSILILDEPTSALDVSVQAQVLNLLLDLQRRHGLTYVFISHNISVVRHMCDHVAVMRGGRLVEQGAADKVLSAPTHPYTRSLLAAAPVLPLEGAA
ncbi:dipeptide ABC transporter ATP-binding protein [Niveispirillum fermenti]|uniref:dipeptide ABC transporter ATP-binding protein n=1 Tax=Niveispirillum fermenti TaxID=1233113 RepID=UPI003A8689A6